MTTKSMKRTYQNTRIAALEAASRLSGRVYARHAGQYMGTTRKRDLRILPHPIFGPEARLVFGPKSSNPKTRKIAKRRARHYAKHGMVSPNSNRDS